eukprot:13963318-Alexandrium_andersonii.AAC.1
MDFSRACRHPGASPMARAWRFGFRPLARWSTGSWSNGPDQICYGLQFPQLRLFHFSTGSGLRPWLA